MVWHKTPSRSKNKRQTQADREQVKCQLSTAGAVLQAEQEQRGCNSSGHSRVRTTPRAVSSSDPTFYTVLVDWRALRMSWVILGAVEMATLILRDSVRHKVLQRAVSFVFMCMKQGETVHSGIRRESVGNIWKQELRKIAYGNRVMVCLVSNAATQKGASAWRWKNILRLITVFNDVLMPAHYHPENLWI